MPRLAASAIAVFDHISALSEPSATSSSSATPSSAPNSSFRPSRSLRSLRRRVRTGRRNISLQPQRPQISLIHAALLDVDILQQFVESTDDHLLFGPCL